MIALDELNTTLGMAAMSTAKIDLLLFVVSLSGLTEAQGAPSADIRPEGPNQPDSLNAQGLVPRYTACTAASSAKYAFCNASLDVEARLDDFLDRLSLEELAGLISPNSSLGSTCNDHTSGVMRLGVPQWMWLVETNTGVNSACYARDTCATTFPGPMGMGASFNRSLWRQKGSVLGSEMRAFHNLGWHRAAGEEAKAFIGLTGFGPNINIARDPRFGRSSELPGEDPTLNGAYAAEMVGGMQERDARGYPKMLAYLKHFTAYSRETNRGHDDYKISEHDLFETYLPQYEIGFRVGRASGAMCSYNVRHAR